MTYYRDLSRYRHSERSKDLNIGWLGAAKPFPQGEVPSEFTDRLWAFCRTHVHQTRGLHDCELRCTSGASLVRKGDEWITIGSAEIRVFGHDGRVYAAPNFIYHYVVVHHYQPPEEFVEAVLAGPLPRSPEYEARASNYEWYEEYTRHNDSSRRGRLVDLLKKSADALAVIRLALPEVTSDEAATTIFHLGTARFEWRDQDILRILTKIDKETIDKIAESMPGIIDRRKKGTRDGIYRLKPDAIERLLSSRTPGP